MDGITSDQVPTNMKVLWEMQVKQLSVKSSVLIAGTRGLNV